MSNHKLLSSKQQAIIDERRERISHGDRNASDSVWELIRRKTIAADELWKDPIWRTHRRFASLSDDQVRVVCLTGKTAGDGLFAPECIGDGIFRRFSMSSPMELALRLSIGARYHWASAQWNGNDSHDELFRPILHAIAARDFTAAEMLASLSTPVIANPNNRAYAAVFTGVCALLKADHQLLQDALKAFPKSVPAYVKAIQSVLEAVANRSSKEFTEGMKKMLSAYRRYMFGDELYGLIDPHAMGLFELCRRYAPEVVADFDVAGNLPWDREYFLWTQQTNDIRDHFEVSSVPDVMRPYILDFKPIAWGQAVLANWNA